MTELQHPCQQSIDHRIQQHMEYGDFTRHIRHVLDNVTITPQLSWGFHEPGGAYRKRGLLSARSRYMSFMLSFIPSREHSSSFSSFSLLYFHIMMQLHTILPKRNDFRPRDYVPAHTSYQDNRVLYHGPYENVAVDSR